MATGRDVVTNALRELGVLAAADVLSAEDSTFGLAKLNRILNNWNAERPLVWTVTFTTYTLTADLSPHTIGPSGTFTVAIRPVSLQGANLVLTDQDPEVRTPLTLRDAQWWLRNSVRDVTSAVPTDLYYDPAWPNGNLYLWPVPSSAYDLELEARVLLSAFTLNGTVSLPPGYEDAFTLTLAEELAPSLLVQTSPQTSLSAQRARARIMANNDRIPRIGTQDSGMPASRSGAWPTFNWLDGTGR